MKFAIFDSRQFLFDIDAVNEQEALAKARLEEPDAVHVIRIGLFEYQEEEKQAS